MSALPQSIDNSLPAKLYRLRGIDASEAVAEEVGSGQFSKMVRLAMSDPDDELWRYSIAVGGIMLTGDQLALFAPAVIGEATTSI